MKYRKERLLKSHFIHLQYRKLVINAVRQLSHQDDGGASSKNFQPQLSKKSDKVRFDEIVGLS